MILRMITLLVIFICSVINYRAQMDTRNRYLDRARDLDYVYISGQIYKYQKLASTDAYYMDLGSGFSAIIYSDSNDISVGDIPIIYGKVNRFEQATNRGEFDKQSFYYSQKVLFSVDLKRVCDTYSSSDERINLNSVKGFMLRNIYEFRNTIETKLLQISGSEQMGTFISLALGDKSLLSSEIKNSYKAVGFSHILAISGMHISIIGMGVYKALRRRRMSFRWSMIMAAIITYYYYLMTGCGVSTFRALGMFWLIMIANTLGRSSDMLNSLGIIVCVIVFRNPFILGYSGFVFSVFAIAGASFSGDFSKDKSIINILKASLLMQLTTLPLIAYYYYEIPVFSVLVNTLLLPLLSVVLMVGIIGAGGGYINILIGKIIMFLPLTILRFYDFICSFLQNIKFSTFVVGKPIIWHLIIYYFVFFSWLSYARNKRQNDKKCSKAISFLTLAILLSLLFIRKNNEELVVLDVGQGACSYIRTDNGTVCMFDGGSSSRTEVGKNVIVPFLKCTGVRQVDYWFVSHGDEDHMNGVAEAIELGYRINNIVISYGSEIDENISELLALCNENRVNVIKINQGDRFVFEESQVECLWPTKKAASNVNLDTNSKSLVLVFKDNINNPNSFSAIFAGDIPEEVEQRLVETCRRKLDVDFYMVTHHGSKYSSCKRWLEALSPSVAVISCGRNNTYGHPHEETIDRLRDCGVEIHISKDEGAYEVDEW